MTSIIRLSARCAAVLAAPVALLLSITPAAAGNRSADSENQPVVVRTDFVFDLSSSGFTDVDEARIIAWFDAIELGYGDRVAISDGYGTNTATANRIAALIGRYGLLLADAAPITAAAPPGTTRIVVSRATATVPGCPNWDGRAEADFQGGLTANYGCAINSNLAAMIANPDDLVKGATTRSDLRTATSNRAIKTWADKPPTGAADLKSETTGGK